MERTKGKLELRECETHEGNTDIWVEGENKNDCGTVACCDFTSSFNKVTAQANTAHLVKCWNSHDDLVEACKNVRFELDLLFTLAERDNEPKCMKIVRSRIEQIKQAIAKAENA